jgi:ABC-type transport system involved in Fe-S cluster assembly fused permease/ATPase subunit
MQSLRPAAWPPPTTTNTLRQVERDADPIPVIESGQIVEQGTHERLLDADGAYASL